MEKARGIAQGCNIYSGKGIGRVDGYWVTKENSGGWRGIEREREGESKGCVRRGQEGGGPTCLGGLGW